MTTKNLLFKERKEAEGFEREVYSAKGYYLHEWPTLKKSSRKLIMAIQQSGLFFGVGRGAA